jgi:hypothetical protein
MEIGERKPSDWCVGCKFQPFYANFKRAEIKDGSIPISADGDGQTPGEAMAEYAKSISNKRLVINSGCTDRREIEVPYLKYLTRD